MSCWRNSTRPPSAYPPIQLEALGLSPGTVLHFKLNPGVTCVVAPNNKVEYQGELMSLSRAAVLALGSHGRHVKAVRGPDYWCYEGQTLTVMRQLRNKG